MINDPITPATLRAKAAEADTGRVQYASSFLMLAADRLEEVERENAQLREALIQIRDQHIGDCPASSAHITDEEWARRCHSHLRSIARTALIKGTVK